ncbi:MAG: STAS domain-containing protein [Solirubrobacteraceae bacterium]
MSSTDRSSSLAPAAPDFSCAWSDGGVDAAWVRPVGELDLATSVEFEEALNAAQARARLVILDLRGLTFLDSRGAHLIVEAGLQAALVGRRLVVIRGEAHVQRVFELTGMDKGLEMVDRPVSLPTVRTDPHLVGAVPGA